MSCAVQMYVTIPVLPSHSNKFRAVIQETPVSCRQILRAPPDLVFMNGPHSEQLARENKHLAPDESGADNEKMITVRRKNRTKASVHCHVYYTVLQIVLWNNWLVEKLNMREHGLERSSFEESNSTSKHTSYSGPGGALYCTYRSLRSLLKTRCAGRTSR